MQGIAVSLPLTFDEDLVYLRRRIYLAANDWSPLEE